MARNAASVLPVPVGETSSTCSPAAIDGQASACAGVGPSGNAVSNQPPDRLRQERDRLTLPNRRSQCTLLLLVASDIREAS